MNLPIGQADLQPNGWPSMWIPPAIAISSSLDPTQSGWDLSQMPITSLSHTHAAYLGKVPHGKPSPFPLAPVNGCSSALCCIKGSPASQMPSDYTQRSSYLSSTPHSSIAPPAFAEQSGVLGAHELLNNGHSQTE